MVALVAGKGCPGVLGIGEVCSVGRAADGRRHLLGLVEAPIDDCHASTLGSHGPGDLGADATGRAGDDHSPT